MFQWYHSGYCIKKGMQNRSVGISRGNRKEGYQQCISMGEKMPEGKAYRGEGRSRVRVVIGWPGCVHESEGWQCDKSPLERGLWAC